ncbi:FtsW/RodA/SpoVE family cell cycle protein [Planococcus lenghuensis]|uniref:Rod shape-determining protein RodA n=1 Tax=Planococcus lenghuensis TaxID=2213202 RepID=A0A1Q2KV95_9BACL|nr:FtsW/RodA/SpoVE family cell cycle protein [Planococcus lenghuensis]AQQ52130.1 rod shape-determining protein RodA [Planococcus lenghuensis]
MQSNKSFTERIDWPLAFLLVLFLAVSLTAIASAQTSGQYVRNFVPYQAAWYLIGLGIAATVMVISAAFYKKAAYYLYGVGILLLFLLMIAPNGPGQIAAPVNGAQAWFRTPVANLQPAELMKTVYILALARLITLHHAAQPLPTIRTDARLLGKIGLLLLVPLALILQQPDLGTALVFIAITVGIVIVAGVSWRLIVPIFGGTALIGAALLWMAVNMQKFLSDFLGLQPYMFARVYTWLDPYAYADNEGYNLVNALKAIGSGELFGKGFMDREVYVPENHTDFIFTVIAEEFGFIGASAVIILFFMLIYRLAWIALDMKDVFSTYVCAGIISMITFHVFQNIGMTIQLVPITGIPLPFISYGGSSLMGNMLAIGVVFSLRFHQQRNRLKDTDFSS